jgi:hypothetical protein
MNTTKHALAVTLLALCTATAVADITAVGASRSVGASRFLSLSGVPFQSQFDRHDQWPTFGDMNASARTQGGAMTTVQESTATQSSALMKGNKLVVMNSALTIRPGQWYPGMAGQGRAGAFSDFSVSMAVNEEVDALLGASVWSAVTPFVTLNADLTVRRDGEPMFNYNVAPTGGEYADSTAWLFRLTPGLWEFTAIVNGTGMAGASTGVDRAGDLRFNLEVTAALVPGVGGATVLAAMGLVTALRRRR